MRRVARVLCGMFVLVLALALVGCSGAGSSQTPIQSPSSTASSTVVGSSSTVTIANFQFTPTPVEVSVGGTVTWTNEDSATHQLLGDAGIKSGPLGQGATYSQTFTKAGTYSYHCTIHPKMQGLVVVK